MYRVTWHKDWSDKGVILHYPFTDSAKVEGSIVKEINKVDNFTFTTYDFETAEQISPIKDIIRVFNTMTNEYEFEGRVFEISKGTTQNGAPYFELVCEGLLGLLHDVGIGNGKVKLSLREHLLYFLDIYNTLISDVNKKIQPGNLTYSQIDRAVTFEYFPEDSAYEIIVNRLVGEYGGEIQLRRVGQNLYFDWVDTIGEISATPIHTGHNLLKDEISSDYSNYATVYVPLGKKTGVRNDRLTINSVSPDGTEYLRDPGISTYGVVMKWLVYDDIDDPTELMQTAQYELSQQKFSHDQYTVSALDLALIGLDIESFKLGNGYVLTDDILQVKNEVLRVVKIDIDINEPELSKVTIGDKFTTVAEFQTNQARLSDYRYRKLNDKTDANAAEIVRTYAHAESAHQRLTDFIKFYNEFIIGNNEKMQSINDRLNKLEATNAEGGTGYSASRYFPVDYNLPGINFFKRSNWAEGTLQYEMTYGNRTGGLHSGYDIGSGGNAGYAVYATTSGKVTWSGWKDGGIGNCIYIDHSTDNWWSNYMHLASMTVSAGDTVVAGQQIGVMGNSGGDYAIHLHYELSPDGVFHSGGNTVNPESYLGITDDNTTSLPSPA